MKLNTLQLKKALSAALFILLLNLAGMAKMYAYDFSAVCETGQTLYYNVIDATNHYVSLTYPGQTSYNAWSGFTKPTGNIVLPESVTYNGVNYTVTRIGEYAFYFCSDITGSLVIPNTITSIGNSAFHSCTGLTGSLTIGNSVTSIGNFAFYYCNGFSGSLTIGNSVTSIGNFAFGICFSFTGTLNIPNSVTSIGDNAFACCRNFTGALVIPNSITDLGDYVFRECSGLTSVTLSNSMNSISNGAFSECTGLIGDLIIPDFVTSIGGAAFYGCVGFTGTLVIPNTVTSIGNSAFNGCTGFTGQLIIPNSVASIGNSAFYGCVGFTGELVLPDSLLTIGNNAFDSCSGLSGNLTIGSSVVSIGSRAFADCIGFTGELIIPNSVTEINGYAFLGCSGFTGELIIGNSVTLIGSKAFYNCSGFTGLTIGNSVTSIGGEAFEGCSGLIGDLTIPASVTSIGSSAFRNCSGMTGGLTIPNSVVSIGNSAFYGCSGFTGGLTISNSVTSIDNYTFNGCTGFTGNLVIPNSVTSIGYSAFQGCRNFTGELTIPTSVTSISDYAFSGCNGLTSITIPNTLTTISDGTFNNCSGLTGNFIIPNTVTSIGRSAFSGCYGLTSIIVPNSVTSIGEYAFSGFYGLTFITIPNSVTTIENSAFSGCRGLTSFAIPAFVTTIGDWAFLNCSGLTSITIPRIVTSIGEYAFSSCTSLTSITVRTETPPAIHSNTFSYTPKTIPLYVPNGCVSAYQSTPFWNEFTNIQEIQTNDAIFFADAYVKALCVANWDTNGDGELSYEEAAVVTDLGEVFNGNTIITSFLELEYFTGLESIGQNAFYGCSNLSSISIPVSVTSIGMSAFYGCSALIGPLAIPNSVTSIGSSAFYNCSGFTGTLTIPEATTSIGAGAFYGCSGLTDLYISSSVNVIGDDAFRGCLGLTSITVHAEMPPAIQSGTFQDVPKSIPVYVPNNSLAAYQSADYWNEFSNILPEINYGPFVITVIDGYGHGGYITGAGTYYYNDTCTLTVISNYGYNFDYWYDMDNYEIVSYRTTYSFVVTGDRTLVAQFVLESDNIDFADYAFKAVCIENWDTNGDGELSYGEAKSVTQLNGAFSGNEDIWIFNDLRYFTELTYIDMNEFYGCSGMLSIFIPRSVTHIYFGAFYGCPLTTVEIGGPLEYIDAWAFYDCSNLQDINLPNTVTYIGDGAFSGCTRLPSLTIPNSVTTIGESVFYCCFFLEQLIVEAGNPVYDSRNNCNAIIETSTNKLIAGCMGTIIPNTVDSIGNYAFAGQRLTSITIPNSVTAIGDYAFFYCYRLTSIGISDSLTSIGDYAFSNCSVLTSVTIPSSVTSIGSGAFAYCGNISTLTIHSSDATFGSYAFNSCTGLTSITVYSEVPPVISGNTFNNVPKTIPVYVPCGSTEAYQSAAYWNEFTNIQENCHEIVHFTTAGNWSQASNWQDSNLPETHAEIYIDANCLLDINAEVADLSIADGQSLTLQSGNTLVVTGTLTNALPTGLVIEDGAQLVNASENVAAVLKKNIAGYEDRSLSGWNTLASPMNGMSIEGSNFLTSSYDLYRFNETNLTNEEWENYKANLEDFNTFEKGRGYLYANSNSFTPLFIGTLNNTDVTRSLTYTNRPNDPLSGFNLIGNPFPHNIYKGAGAAIDNANLASGYYTLTNEGTWQVHTFEDAILPGQGILVQTTAPTVLTIAKSNVAASSESSEDERCMGSLSISVAGDNGQDQAYVYFGQGVDLDKVKDFGQNAPNLSIRTKNGDFAIAHFDKKSDTIELVIKIPDSGSFMLNVKAIANNFEYLHLTDTSTSADIDLLQQPTYFFNATDQAGEMHFKLVYRQ